MQFIVNSTEEYELTIGAIISAEIYEELALIYALDLVDDKIGIVPEKYPCIVSLEIEDFSSDNRRYVFNSCKFMYPNDILTGNDYQSKLLELKTLDLSLAYYQNMLETSGTLDNPTDEIHDLQIEIGTLEKELF